MIEMPFISWTDILSTSAVISTVLQFLTGTLICQKYVQRKSTGDTSGFPFICGFLSCSLWLKYGFLTNEQSLILVNTIGATLMFTYSIIYYIFTINKNSTIKQFLIVILILLMTIIYTLYENDLNKSIDVIGILCCTITVLFFASPLTLLLHVIKMKNAESLPFPLILASFFVSLQWFFYGVLIQDTFIQIPNFMGTVLSGAQLLLFICYPSKTTNTGPAYKPLDQTVIF